MAPESSTVDCRYSPDSLLVTAGLYYEFAGRGGDAIDSVAVLPFVDAGADPNTEYLSDGITESLINNLS